MSREPLFTRPFLLSALAQFLHGLSFNLYLHLPGFLAALGAGETVIGLVYASAAAASVVARPAIGRLIDARGSRLVVRWGCAVNVFACALYLTVDSLGPWLYAVRVVHGVAEAMLFAAFFAYAADIIPESRRIEGIAIFGVSGLLPVSVGGLIGDLLLADHGYPVLFAATVALALAALVAAATLPPLPPPDDPGRAPARGILRTLLDPRLMPLWMIGVAFAGALTSVVTFLKTFVLTAGVGSVGLFWTAYTATAIGLRLPLGSVPDRFGPKRVLAASIGFFAAGLLLLARAESDLDVGVAGGLGGIGHAYVFPILISIVVDRAPVADRGSALAIFTALFDAGVLIGGPCLGALVHRTSYPVMYSAASAVAVVACAVFLVWDRRND